MSTGDKIIVDFGEIWQGARAAERDVKNWVDGLTDRPTSSSPNEGISGHIADLFGLYIKMDTVPQPEG